MSSAGHSQVNKKPITNPPSDQGAIVINCPEHPTLAATRDALSDGTSKFPTTGRRDVTHYVVQRELAFTNKKDLSARNTGEPFIWTSFNDINSDEKIAFVGVADDSSRNLIPGRRQAHVTIPLCTRGLRTIPNNSWNNLFPGDTIIWTEPSTIDNNGTPIPILREPNSSNNKFTAGITKLEFNSGGSTDLYLELSRFLEGGIQNTLVGIKDERGVPYHERVFRVTAACRGMAEYHSEEMVTGSPYDLLDIPLAARDAEDSKYTPKDNTQKVETALATLTTKHDKYLANLVTQDTDLAYPAATKTDGKIAYRDGLVLGAATSQEEYKSLLKTRRAAIEAIEDKDYMYIWGEHKSVVDQRFNGYKAKFGDYQSEHQKHTKAGSLLDPTNKFTKVENYLAFFVMMETEYVRSRFYQTVIGRIIGRATNAASPGEPLDIVLTN